MAKIEAILKVSDDDVNGEVEVATTSLESNNISSYAYTYDILDFIESMSVENKSYNGAIVKTLATTPTINELRFGALLSDGTRQEKYNGLLLGNSDSNKNCALTLSLTGSAIIGIEIYFDNYVNQFPTNFSYTNTNGETTTITNNTSNKIVISEMPASYGTFTITFTKWNLASTPIGITFINFPTDKIKLNKAQIISFESQAQAITSTNGINYGVIATTGKMEINDKDNTLYNKAKLGYLNAFLFTLDIKVNSKSIQTHISTNSPLYTSDRQINLDLTDQLALWDSIMVREQEFNVGQSLYDVVTYLATYFEDIDVSTMCDDWVVIGNSISTHFTTRMEARISFYLQNIKFNQVTTLNEGTLREQFEKICTCAQLSIYINRDNQIKFISARPNYMYEKQPLKIPFSKQYSRPSYDLLVANRYEEVEFK